MIPKIVHLSWKDKDVVNSQSDLIKNGLRNLIDLNPDWRVEISTDAEVDAYLKDQLGEDYALVEDAGIVAKTDIWRLIKLFNEGGLYIDIDRFCNVKLSDLINDQIKWVLPTCADMDFSHDFMMTAPGNPAYANTIALYLQRRKEGHTNIYFLGAQTYMHGVTYTLFGEMINTDPGVEAFQKIRERLAQIPFIRTYRETPPYDTLVYQGDVSTESWEAMKRGFYAESGVKHWTGEW
jgi:hypothetical protein